MSDPIIEDYIECLDHGYVRLVDRMGDDLSIVRAARVSYDAEPRLDGSDAKLIRYLWKNRHTSPFESVFFTFEVKAPIFVFRQWHRHRTWKFNEVSARYSVLPAEYYIPDEEHVGVQSEKSKQARDLGGKRPDFTSEKLMYRSSCDIAYTTYLSLLKLGWPRELARACLPVSMYSHMFASIDLHNLFKFLELRLHSHAQYEIRVYAEAMLQMIKPFCQTAVGVFEEGLENG